MGDYQHINVTVEGVVGAAISGVDLTRLTPEILRELRAAFAEHAILFFRDQDLTPAQHQAFAEAWGEINVNRFFTPVPDFPKIAEVRKEPDQKLNIGGGWHTDHTYDQIPALGSMLYALEVPERGGDTMFANTCLAFDTLSDGLKETLCDLRAVHSAAHVFGRRPQAKGEWGDRMGNEDQADVDAVHPVVITHPLSGRKSLYVNPGFTLRFDGWSAEESQPLLEYLYRHVARPEHTYRWVWRKGSMAFWDNRATWHFAINDYQGQRRLMHRITLDGESIAA